MSRTIETTVYKFDELSEQAKENARQWWRECEDTDFDVECICEDAQRMGALLGITIDTHAVKLMGGGTRQEPTIYYSGFCSQGDGACFEGSYQYAKNATSAINKETNDLELLRIAKGLQEIQKRNFYQLTARTKHSGFYYHSGCLSVTVDREDEKEMTDDAEDEIRDLLRSFADWIYDQLKAEYEYRMIDENIDESIRINEYEFTEDGQII